MRFAVLGPFHIFDDAGAPVTIGPPKLRLLAAVLLCRRGPVGSSALIEAIWNACPPAHAADNLRVYIHHLRRIVGHHRIRRGPGGYELLVDPQELDTHRFRQLESAGRTAAGRGQPRLARDHLRAALALWRGEAFADIDAAGTVRVEAAALAALRVDTHERCINLELALGYHCELVEELRALCAANPMRETLHAQLMLALARCGRRPEAVLAYEQIRHQLADELGIDPGPRLRELHLDLLRR